MQQQIEEFLDYLSSEKGYSGNTLAAYRNDLTQFALYLTDESNRLRQLAGIRSTRRA